MNKYLKTFLLPFLVAGIFISAVIGLMLAGGYFGPLAIIVVFVTYISIIYTVLNYLLDKRKI